MSPPPFLWPYALIFWSVYAWALVPEMRIIRRARDESKRTGSQDAGSVRVMMGVMSTVMVLAFPLAFVERWSFPESQHRLLFAAGITLMVLGSLLRRYCWTTLGEYFTGDVQVRAGQPVIRTGPYHLERHTSYTRGTLINGGGGLALCSWLCLTLPTVSALAPSVYLVTM